MKQQDHRAHDESSRSLTPFRSALTWRGRGLLAGGAVTAVAGLLLRYPELIALGVAGIAAALVALLSVIRAPAVQVERVVTPARVSRNSTDATARILIRNSSRRSLPTLLVRDVAGPATVTHRLPRLRPGAEYTAHTPLPTSRRGVVPSGPLLVERADGFGLAHRTLVTGQLAELYVRPRAVPLPEIAASLARSVDGPQSDTTMEGTLAFHTLREYVPGDELRHVHWRASAHAGKLVVKQHVDTAHAALAVVLDLTVLTSQVDAIDAFETAVDCAASVAVIAAAQRQPLQLLDPAGQSLLPPAVSRRGGSTVDDVLDALTRTTSVPSGTPNQLPHTLRRLSGGSRGSLAVVISTRPMDGLAESLRQLAGCYARVLAVRTEAGTDRPGSATRTGRVLWVAVRHADELASALVRARAAA
jgi:uncharacterized protein (DUF58 family)